MPSLPGGLRLRLTLAICGVSLAVVAGSFLALRATTQADLRDRIDQELRDQQDEFDAAVPASQRRTPASLERAARRFLSEQGYHASSRIFAVQPRGRALVTNQPDLLRRDGESDGSETDETTEELGESGLLEAPEGLADVSGPETGALRVLTASIDGGATRVGTFRVADPLRSVEDAESGLNRAFLLVGLAVLLVSAGLAAAIATVLTRPLRRMARVATDVGEGDLQARIGNRPRNDEIGVLADAFDRMLDRLERAFARQREFVSDASHELRTPLTVMRGQVELLDHEQDPERRHSAVDTVLREVDRMNRLVDEMLTLASSESTPLVRPEAIDLADFVDDLRRDLPLFGDRAYAIDGATTGTLQADPERLHQILRNLIRNAVAATHPRDSIQVTLTGHGATLEFAVSDTGPGIPADELERVFDRFHRTDAARNRGHGGTGLGLAIAQALVQAHGGEIGAESTPGRGTTIRFTIPGYAAT